MDFPRRLAKGDYVYQTMRIRTQGEWDGGIAVILLLRSTFSRSQTIKLPLSVSDAHDDVSFLRVEPEPAASLSAEGRDQNLRAILALGIRNDRPTPIRGATLNFRVPDWVRVMYPCKQDGERHGGVAGSLLTASEVLFDSNGKPSGEGIKYWAQPEITFPGEISLLSFFCVEMEEPREVPVRITVVSPDLEEPIEIAASFLPGSAEPVAMIRT